MACYTCEGRDEGKLGLRTEFGLQRVFKEGWVKTPSVREATGTASRKQAKGE